MASSARVHVWNPRHAVPGWTDNPMYVTDFGELRTVDIPAYTPRKDNQPDMRFKSSQPVVDYFNWLNAWAEREYIAGRDPTVAPSFAEFSEGDGPR